MTQADQMRRTPTGEQPATRLVRERVANPLHVILGAAEILRTTGLTAAERERLVGAISRQAELLTSTWLDPAII